MSSTAIVPVVVNNIDEEDDTFDGGHNPGGGDKPRDEDIESEDEESWDREAYLIERDLINFTDEPRVEHNEYPESDEEAEKRFKTRKTDRDAGRGPGYLRNGMTFFNSVAFKEAVVDYVLRTARNIKQYRYDKNRVAYKCAGKGCDWRIYCSVNGNSEVWKVRVFNEVHSCIPNGKVEMMKVPVIARLFLEKIRCEPEYFMPKKMESFMFEKWRIKASRDQCQAARKKAIRWIEREYDHQFSRLRDYAAEILHSNENSTVEIGTVMSEDGLEVLSRFYVCFDILRRTWRESCRPLLGLDSCHVKSSMKGILLVALGRDADNRIYPVAWAYVQKENSENWTWFVEKLKDDLGLMEGDGFVMISDRQKGLLKAIEKVLPRIEHRMCVRHIYANLKSKIGKKAWMKQHVWNLAWSYNEVEYNANLERIFCYDTKVHEAVLNEHPRTWSRAFFRLGSYCEDVENNSTESFNASIVKAREKPLVPMLETIRRLAMVRINTHFSSTVSHNGICTPYVAQFFAKEHKRASECIVTRSTNQMFEVQLGGCSYRVSLDKMTCSCRKYDLCGIPCEHAYGAILYRQLHPENYVCHWFHTSTWKRNYVEGLIPLRGSQFWPKTGAADIHKPTPSSMPGRPKKGKDKRMRGRNESPPRTQKKQLKRVMHCSICSQPNHNSRFHKSGALVISQAESSQVQGQANVE